MVTTHKHHSTETLVLKKPGFSSGIIILWDSTIGVFGTRSRVVNS